MRLPGKGLKWPTRNYVLVLIVAGAAIRLLLGALYDPMLFPDSLTYIGLAHGIKNLELEAHRGFRTPGYPLLILLSSGKATTIWILQGLLGILTSLMVFKIAWDQLRRPLVALAAGLLVSLSLNQLYLEAAIMTEALGAFLVVLSLMIYLKLRGGTRGVWAYVAFGGLLGYAALTRPNLLVLALLYSVLFLWGRWRGRRAWKEVLALLAPFVLLVGTWSVINKVTLGYLGPSTLVGYNLTQHCGAYIERAPDRFAPVRDIYLKHRAGEESHHMVIWEAISEMRAATGMSTAELSRELTRMSLSLFAGNPLRFLGSYLEAFLKFWAPTSYWIFTEEISAPADEWNFAWAGRYEGFLLWIPIAWGSILRGVFVCALVVCFVVRRGRPLDDRDRVFGVMAVICVVAGLFQALWSNGENFRYLMPFAPVLTCAAIAGATIVWSRLRTIPS